MESLNRVTCSRTDFAVVRLARGCYESVKTQYKCYIHPHRVTKLGEELDASRIPDEFSEVVVFR